MQIIEKTESQTTVAPAELESALFEPVFLSDKILLDLSKSKLAETIVDFMAQKIVRTPANLQLHLNRIYCYSQQANRDGIYAALLDLFLVLDEKGLPLRQRLLQKYHRQLNSEQHGILSDCLSGKLEKTTIVSFVKESMLSDGRTGALKLVEKQKLMNQVPIRDVVEDARDLINSAQIGEATVLLKKAILVNPQREDIGQELMIIYRHSRNYQAVVKLLQSTKNLPLALQSQWEELVAFLKAEVSEHDEKSAC